jgi:two-component system LytT family sensor kinase
MRKTESPNGPVFMHPVIFVSASVLIGILFGLQEWVSFIQWGVHIGAAIVFESWTVEFFIWGCICWTLWRLLGTRIQSAKILPLIALFLPLSVLTGVAEEALFVFIFPNLPISKVPMSYLRRFTLSLDAELFDNIVIFWCALLLFRGIGYYQRYREKEQAAAQLEIQLANAQISALRMQLNPHFLFNAMNSISSLMRVDLEAADSMLEQLSCLMRMTLERGDAQLISVHEEMEFIETYLAMQAQRYAGRVEQTVSIDPELHDALVPVMLLQPIVENAYVHGLSKIHANGVLSIIVRRDKNELELSVVNSGVGLVLNCPASTSNHRVGLANTKSRLMLHYGESASFSITELDGTRVQVLIRTPLRFSPAFSNPTARYETQ